MRLWECFFLCLRFLFDRIQTYIRIWRAKTVIIIDSKEGFKQIKKKPNHFKFIFGFSSC
ncbi:DUF3977 family protein [Gottfriedia sp. NPDC057948]|uniref:DUF3977 family protein n=1 Tax=Gottfriedia sp. NPDC057948 TaxID=3346287 RepID=UPI0036D90353